MMSAPGTRETKILGFPISDFGFFSSLLLALSTGFISFFATAFLGIVVLLIYNLGGHHQVDYAMAYKAFAFPIGCVALALGFLIFGGVWIRSKLMSK